MKDNNNLPARNIANEEKELTVKIRHMLLLNPLMDFKVVKHAYNSIAELKLGEKWTFLRKLNESRKEFVREASDTDNVIEYVKDHLENWNQEIAPLTIDDIMEIIKGTKMDFMDLAEKYITPMAISQKLNQYLIGQDEYSRKLSLCFYMHVMRSRGKGKRMPRPSLLAYGPSGVGKTFGPQTLAKLFGFKLGVVNCNTLVQEGIVGQTVTDVFTELYAANGNSVDGMEDSVIFFDEFDKLFEAGYYNERILNEILNIIDDNNTVQFATGSWGNSKERVSTGGMLFIFSGVFSGIESIVQKRVNTHSIGFGQEKGEKVEGDYHRYVQENDFAEYFNRAEIAGRITQYAYVCPISKDGMANILRDSKESPVGYFEDYFNLRGIGFNVTDDGAEAIADYAARKNLGVRGLKSTLFKILEDDMFTLDKQEIVVDKEYVERKTA
ncbi:MAG: AAA family ATPase [Prevotella sp.]|nr:AAA family ATPase [Prevotella sp.]